MIASSPDLTMVRTGGGEEQGAATMVTEWSSTSPSAAGPLNDSAPAELKRKRAKVVPATADVGTAKVSEFIPPTSGWDAKICSPASAQSPSALKSIQASSKPADEAVTCTIAVVPTTGKTENT